jgi:hypothetical protein
METQLTLSAVKTSASAIKPEDVQRLVSTLKRETKWQTARELAALLFGKDCNPNTERKIRAIASAACPVVVSYPGSPGYRHFDHCTMQELNHCTNAFHSQGVDMFKRETLYIQAIHRRRAELT